MAIVKFFVGIDISKATLDISIIKDGSQLLHEKIENTTDSIKAWIDKITNEPGVKRFNTIFCMESGGLYGEYLLKVLLTDKFKVWVESALHIKRTLGLQRGKSDKIDSLRISEYAYIHRSKFKQYIKPRSQLQQLKLLNGLRNRIVAAHLQLATVLKDHNLFLKKVDSKAIYKGCKSSLSALKQDQKSAEQAMINLIKSDEKLDRLFKILCSIHCIGRLTAIELLIATNEFKKFDSSKKFACYCGVAPFEHTSGTSVRGKSRVSKIANIKIKTALHLCAIVAVRSKGEFYDYYKRKVEEGKSKMSVLNAIRNKLIHRVFACIKEDRLYEKRDSLSTVKAR